MNNETKIIKDNIKRNMGYSVSEQEETNSKLAYNKSFTRDKVPPRFSYVPKMTAIFSDGTVLDLIEFVNILQIEWNSIEYVFPLFSLQLSIPTLFIPKIQFDDNIQFRLEILASQSEEEIGMLYDKIMDVTLVKIKQNSSPVNVEDEVYTENENSQYINKQILELKLIPNECLKANKYLFSGVYHDCTVTDMISLISSKLPTKAFIEQPSNLREYKQMIFTPYNVFYSLSFLDYYYGIYTRGLKMFYGFNQFRIQSRNYVDLTGTNKIKVSFSNESETPDVFSNIGNGLLKLDSDNFITILPNAVKILDRRNYIKEVFGSKITNISRDSYLSNEVVREYNEDTIPKINKVKTYVNYLNNNLKESEYFNRTKFTKTLEISLMDIMLDAESWFKPFALNFDSKHYYSLNGNYTLSNYVCRLVRTNPNNPGSFYATKTVIVLEEV